MGRGREPSAFRATSRNGRGILRRDCVASGHGIGSHSRRRFGSSYVGCRGSAWSGGQCATHAARPAKLLSSWEAEGSFGWVIVIEASSEPSGGAASPRGHGRGHRRRGKSLFPAFFLHYILDDNYGAGWKGWRFGQLASVDCTGSGPKIGMTPLAFKFSIPFSGMLLLIVVEVSFSMLLLTWKPS